MVRARRSDGLYESPETRLLREVAERDPQVRRARRSGWDMFWDHNLDWEELRRFAESSVRQKPYVYDPELTPQPFKMPGSRH